MNTAQPAPRTFQAAVYRKFVIFSLIGFLLFLTPIKWNGVWTIGIGVLANALKAQIGPWLPALAALLVTISAVGTVWAKCLQPAWSRSGKGADLFQVGWLWVCLRVVGAVFILMIFFQVGPQWVIGKATGGTILNDLNPTLMPFFFFAVLLISLLTDYGFMEYIGTLLSRMFRKLFRLPGRSAVDACASWLGAAPMGVLITSLQYERGQYSLREAAAIATSFSLASAAFCLLITEFMGLNDKFPQFYATVSVVSLVAAVVMVRIPPLSRKSDSYLVGNGDLRDESCLPGLSLHASAVQRALVRAEEAPGLGSALKSNLVILADVYLGLMPVVFALGTAALAISEYTPLFTYLSAPMVPLLEWLHIPEATAAAPAMLVGFADMFLPAVLGKGIESELTRFVIACMSVTQVIYMTEVGALILKSKIEVSFVELVLIFVLRTLLTLPLVALIAHTLVY